MSGIFLVTKIRNIQQGRERTELQWQGSGKQREEISRCMNEQN